MILQRNLFLTINDNLFYTSAQESVHFLGKTFVPAVFFIRDNSNNVGEGLSTAKIEIDSSIVRNVLNGGGNHVISLFSYDFITNVSAAIISGSVFKIENRQNMAFLYVKSVHSNCLLQPVINESSLQRCQATFCDRYCGLNITNFVYEGGIERILSSDSFFDSNVTFQNPSYVEISGKTIDVISFSDGMFVLSESIFGNDNLQISKYRAFENCDKTPLSCQKFNNITNFRVLL